MKKFLALILMTLCTGLMAGPLNYEGSWSGQGVYVLENKVTHCHEFKMIFSATDKVFTFVTGNRRCDDHDEEFYRVDMDYSDGKVYFGGQVVGSYTENSLETSFSVPEGDRMRHWRMSMRVTGEQLLYEESRSYDEEKTPYINFAGIMIAE